MPASDGYIRKALTHEFYTIKPPKPSCARLAAQAMYRGKTAPGAQATSGAYVAKIPGRGRPEGMGQRCPMTSDCLQDLGTSFLSTKDVPVMSSPARFLAWHVMSDASRSSHPSFQLSQSGRVTQHDQSITSPNTFIRGRVENHSA